MRGSNRYARLALLAGAFTLAPATTALVLAWRGDISLGLALIIALAAFLGAAVVLARPLRDADRLAGPSAAKQSPGRIALWLGIGAAEERAERERERLEEEMRARRDREGRSLDAHPDPLLTFDEARRIHSANASARRVFGEDLTGRDLTETFRDPVLLGAVDRALEGAGTAEAEFRITSPVALEYECAIRPLGDTEARFLLILRDVTAVRQTERMRADFIANASHEIRTPLATLAGCVETLIGPARDDPAARDRFLDIMSQQAERMTRLVQDLLSLSRIELSEHTVPTDTVKIAPLLARVVDGLALPAREAAVALDLQGTETDVEVVGDEGELEQVFHNLIDNAVKYGADGDSVEILCERTSGTITLDGRDHPVLAVTVVDHGDGISDEHRPRLTERFYRADTARSRALGGTGLGLAIVKHIVNRHRGDLAIASTPGEGSRFTVRLPLSLSHI